MSDIPNQTDLVSQQTAEIHDLPVGSRGYNPAAIPDTPQSKTRKTPVMRVDPVTHTFRSFTIEIDGTPRTILTANSKRRYLFIQNKGNQDIQLAFGAMAIPNNLGAQNTIDLPAGTSITFEHVCPNNDVFAVCLPVSELAIIEGSRD